GNAIPNTRIKRKTRWPTECIKFVEGVVEEQSCFYIEELQVSIQSKLMRMDLATYRLAREGSGQWAGKHFFKLGKK
ncbi:hypothetical protein L916_15007, partial [Phytophthora nicotianae]